MNCRFTLQPTWKRLRHFFRIIVSANQLSLYGAVAEMCEEYESLHERTGRPVVMAQSIVLSAIKTEVSLESDDPVYQNFLFRQYEERVEKLSQQDKLSGQGGHQGMSSTGGGGLARVPNLRVCKHL